MTSSKRNYLPKVLLPDPNTLGFRASTYAIGRGGTNIESSATSKRDEKEEAVRKEKNQESVMSCKEFQGSETDHQGQMLLTG